MSYFKWVQFPVDLTETEFKIHLLKIKDDSATKAFYTSWRSDYISYGELDVDGCDWVIRYYPNHSDLRRDWIAFRLVLLRKRCENEVVASFRYQLVDGCGILSPFRDQCVANRYMDQEDLGPPLLLATHGELLKLDYIKTDSFSVECTISVQRRQREETTSDHMSVALPSSDLHQQLGELLQSQKGADVTFVVSGESFMAHKVVLAARSPIFMAEFFGPMKESSSDHVEIKGIEPAAFKAMLHFIYTDTCPEVLNSLNNMPATLGKKRWQPWRSICLQMPIGTDWTGSS
uniref:BTB domain-containing protein n=1 Tax=Arundo donax TaxID=35708 RepID=A0A0A9DKI9_ARUDO